MKNLWSILLFLVSLSPGLPVSAASGDWQIAVKNDAGQLAPYNITLTNGQVLGKTAGIPAAITLTGGAWGSITGTLSAQTDLQAALDAKQPLNSKLTTLSTGFGASFLGTGIVRWTGSDYALQLDAIPANVGGTGQTSYTLGAILYASDTVTLGKLAGNTTTTKKFLSQTGAGFGQSAAPEWSTLALSDLPQSGASTNQVLTWSGTAWAPAAGGGGVTIGSTAITGGTSGRLLVSGTSVGELTPGTGVFTWLATNTKANLAAAVSDDDPAFLASANAFTDTQTVTVGTNSATPADGLILQNSTAAISGTQSASPGLTFSAQGWKTGGTPGTNRLDWNIYALPVQAAASDISLIFRYRVASGSYVDQMRLSGTDQVNYRGLAFAQTFSLIPSFSSNAAKLDISATGFNMDVSSATKFVVNNSGAFVSVPSGYSIGWSLSSTTAGTQDTSMTRASAGIVGVSGLRVGSSGSSIGVIKRATATLVAGTVTVADTGTTANTQIIVTVVTPGGVVGFLDVDLSAGVGYTINSTSAADTSSLIITAIHHP